MAEAVGGSFPPTSYYFGSRKLHPLYYQQLEGDDLLVVLPDFSCEALSASSTPQTTSKPPPKNPWGVVATNSKKTWRRGWVQKQPLEYVLVNLDIERKPAMFHPRGLQNNDRKCFLNTTIQTLMAVPQFYSLMRKISRSTFQATQSPVLSRLVKLYEEFEPLSPSKKTAVMSGTSVSIPLGTKLAPLYFYDLLKGFNPLSDDLQEDMQEFLLYVLDRAHTELLEVASLIPGEVVEDDERLNAADEWSTVGKNNKAAIVVTDVSKFKQSPISRIFAGEMQSVVKRRNAKSSMAVEPFFCLHLDVASEHISTLEDALGAYMTSETLEDANGSTKANSIKTLPPVLLIHLKRFAYVGGKSQKITKPIYFPEHLSMKSKWLGSGFTIGREYSLHSVTQHLGPRAQGGHYTSYVHQCNGDWLLFDDANVEKVDLSDVLDCANGYILCYLQNP